MDGLSEGTLWFWKGGAGTVSWNERGVFRDGMGRYIRGSGALGRACCFGSCSVSCVGILPSCLLLFLPSFAFPFVLLQFIFCVYYFSEVFDFALTLLLYTAHSKEIEAQHTMKCTLIMIFASAVFGVGVMGRPMTIVEVLHPARAPVWEVKERCVDGKQGMGATWKEGVLLD